MAKINIEGEIAHIKTTLNSIIKLLKGGAVKAVHSAASVAKHVVNSGGGGRGRTPGAGPGEGTLNRRILECFKGGKTLAPSNIAEALGIENKAASNNAWALERKGYLAKADRGQYVLAAPGAALIGSKAKIASVPKKIAKTPAKTVKAPAKKAVKAPAKAAKVKPTAKKAKTPAKKAPTHKSAGPKTAEEAAAEAGVA